MQSERLHNLRSLGWSLSPAPAIFVREDTLALIQEAGMESWRP